MALLSSARRYSGRVINLDVDTVRLPDGSSSELEMVRHPGAAAVVPFVDAPDGSDPRVVLLYQFRHAAEGYIWEVPAGRLDPGEAPEACARRELLEETGMTAERFQPLTALFTTPGFTDEKIHLFLASGLREGQHRREPDEFLEMHTKRWSEIMDMVAHGTIQDGKTLTALMYVECFVRP
jgi:ADP-ribose pyrophosphatase